jgi:hypothetical protein
MPLICFFSKYVGGHFLIFQWVMRLLKVFLPKFVCVLPAELRALI